MALALLTLACGGSVDLESPDASSDAGRGGSGGGTVQGLAGKPAAAGGNEQQGTGGRGVAGASGGSTSVAGMAGESALGGSPAMPGEQWIAWLAFDAEPEGESRGVYWMSAASGGDCLERLTEDGVNAKQAAFSSDGNVIAYAADASGTYQIYTRELTTGVVTQVTDLPQGATYPTFSPDDLLAFVTGDPESFRDGVVTDSADMGDVMLVDLKTLETVLVEPRDPNEDYPYFAPAFSGRDRLIVSNSHVIRALYLEFDGPFVRVANRRVLSTPGVPQEPAPSPNGRKVAYADTCTDTLQLYMLDIDTGSPRSCVPASREYLPDAGVRAADWGSFGLIAVQYNTPTPSLSLFSEEDLTLTMHVPAPSWPRNPSWAPADFTRACQ